MTCGDDMPCKTYEEYFKNATYFCEHSLNYTYKVYPDDQPCMKFEFDPSKGNPNDAVARNKTEG